MANRRVKSLALAISLATALTSLGGVAHAYWSQTAPGTGTAQTDTLGAAAAPAASVDGNAVALAWSAVTTGAGNPVTGYQVLRYASASGGAGVTPGGSCAGDGNGIITSAGCTDQGVADGTHYYTVTPVLHSWTGEESSPRTEATVSSVAAFTGITFPAHGQTYGAGTYNSGCGTSGGDFCGTAGTAGNAIVTSVRVSVRHGSGNYWDPDTGGFTRTDEKLFPVTSGTTDWTVSFPLANFAADGQHTVRAESTDNLGRTTSASSTFTIDRTPPAAPTITSAPANPTNQTSASFGFSHGQSGMAFECTLNDGWYAACTSPVSYSGLAQGAHTFSVRATDSLGNTSGASSYTWTVDTTAPTAIDVQAANTSGGDLGKMEAGDTLTFFYSEQVDPESIKSGWNGSATAVYLRMRSSGNSSDKLTVFGDAALSTQLSPLGEVDLRHNAYASADVSFTATMVQSGSQIVITLGTPSDPAKVGKVSVANDMHWKPGSGATDLAGNPLSNAGATVTERRQPTGAPADVEF